ncbi:MAG: hypothetical protein EPO24_16065 [Bacteroidetes bacterium]|nr:MAG: hypothetical protein EPO24_16065 [Bacteroidota bacterium]
MSFHQNKQWRRGVFALALSFLLLYGLLPAQPCTPSLAQPICVTETHASLDQLTIGDIDFENFGSSHWFFTLNINSFVEPLSVRLVVSVDITLASESFPNAVNFRTLPFNTPQTISNLDIGKNGSIKTESFEFSEEAKNRIKDIALATGRLPSGTYTFNIRVEDVTNVAAYDEKQIILTLQNFSRIELLSPLNNSDVPTTFPLFQWQYDGDNVELSVYEKLSHHQSNEEALTGTPYLVIRSGEPGLPEGVRTFQYPPSGVRAIELGKTYVWAIRSISSGTGGSDAGLNSEVWAFTVSGTGGGANDDYAEQLITTEQLAEELNDIPGIDAEALKKFLEDYRMTGAFYVNGQLISLAEMRQLLADLLANPDRIIELKVID